MPPADAGERDNTGPLAPVRRLHHIPAEAPAKARAIVSKRPRRTVSYWDRSGRRLGGRRRGDLAGVHRVDRPLAGHRIERADLGQHG